MGDRARGESTRSVWVQDHDAPPVHAVDMVVRLFDPWVGGMERQALKLSRALVLRGLRVRILTGRWFPDTLRREPISGVEVLRHHTLWDGTGVRGLRKLGAVAYMATLAWHLWRRREAASVIHVHGLSYHAFVAVALGRLTGRPVVVKLANSGTASDISKMRAGKHFPLTKLMLPIALAADRLVALNDLVVDELRRAGVPDERIARIPNGVELPEPRASYATGASGATILYVGRLHRQKAIEDLLGAFASLRENRPESRIELRLVGDGPERASLEELAGELGIGESTRFVGLVDDVGPHLADADVLVLPSIAEGLSNTLLEAMATGLPVVASDIVANRGLIRDGVDGMLFPPGDVHSLASVLDRLLGDEDLRERLGREGRKTVEAGYSIDSVAEAYEALYVRLLGERIR